MDTGTMFVELINDVGVNVALIVFFVWQGKRILETQSKENSALSTRLHNLEAETRKTLVEMAKESSKALTNNTEVTKENTRVIGQLIRALKSKPCMIADDLPTEPDTSALERTKP